MLYLVSNDQGQQMIKYCCTIEKKRWTLLIILPKTLITVGNMTNIEYVSVINWLTG